MLYCICVWIAKLFGNYPYVRVNNVIIHNPDKQHTYLLYIVYVRSRSVLINY